MFKITTSLGLVLAFLFVVASSVANIFFPINPIYSVLLMVVVGAIDIITQRERNRVSVLNEKQDERLDIVERKLKSIDAYMATMKARPGVR